jgi:Splicing factor 3B subunit 10 (SF3b10)
VNQHRDSIATFIGHSNVLRYMAFAQDQSIERTRMELLTVTAAFLFLPDLYVCICLEND